MFPVRAIDDRSVFAAWVALAALLAGVLWGALGGFESSAVIWVVLLAGVVAAGFVAGAVCWARGHKIVGLIGLASPAAPVVGHVLALRYGPDEAWAPTIVGDLLGLAAALVGSLLALVGALATRQERARSTPTSRVRS
ncbi:MAG: hypothetical protein ACFCVK_13535 [Acidimicrobiales bacterium]